MGEAIVGVQDLGTKLGQAFTDADIPTFDELFADLLAGDFSGLIGKLQKGLDSLVFNLETEVKISLGMEEDEPWDIAQRITQLVNDITAAVNKLDVTKIDWMDVFDRLILTPLGAAIKGISLAADIFMSLVTAVTKAIIAIPWGDLGGAFGGLTTAIITQLGNVVNDIIADLTPLFFLMSLSIGEQVRLLREQMLPKPVAATPADSGTMEADFARVPETVATTLDRPDQRLGLGVTGQISARLSFLAYRRVSLLPSLARSNLK